MKSEPDAYSLEQLKKDKKTLWDGVRNYQARNFMWKEMSKGDQILFYHSNAKPSGVVGIAEISKNAVPDPSAFDKKSDYYDPKSDPDNPRWFCVEVKFKKSLKQIIPLQQIKEDSRLKDMVLVNNSRLSVQPVTAKEYKILCELGGV